MWSILYLLSRGTGSRCEVLTNILKTPFGYRDRGCELVLGEGHEVKHKVMTKNFLSPSYICVYENASVYGMGVKHGDTADYAHWGS